MKVVFDTSVLIASFYRPLYGPSFSKDVYDYVVEHETAYVSPEILAEFRRVCARKLKLDTHSAGRLASLVLLKVNVEKIKKPHTYRIENIPLRDPTDIHVIELAQRVGADLILTWDKDLLVLNKVGNRMILDPKTFWDAHPDQ